MNTKTRLRDQERSPISSDIKRAMREKASRGLITFELTADVKEAHRQIPIDPRDWHLLGCQVERGADVCVILLVQSLLSSWEINPVSGVGSS